MNDLTRAAKKGKKVNNGEQYLKRMEGIDGMMKEQFCPLIDGDCRGMRCMFFDEYSAAANDEDVCKVKGFLYGAELSLSDIARSLEKKASIIVEYNDKYSTTKKKGKVLFFDTGSDDSGNFFVVKNIYNGQVETWKTSRCIVIQ